MRKCEVQAAIKVKMSGSEKTDQSEQDNKHFLHNTCKQEVKRSFTFLGDVTRDDLQRRLLAQHGVAMLEQCCNYWKQCRNNISESFV